MGGSTGVFLALLVVGWVLQGMFSFWQAKRFYGRIQQLRTLGRTAVGVAGSIYRTKAYGVLAVDGENRIVRAEKLSGFTFLAQPKPVQQLAGMTLSDFLSGPVNGLSPKLYDAFKMAAESLVKESEAEVDREAVDADSSLQLEALSGTGDASSLA
jgi:DNA-binding transcriptional regulator of glucitol operon